MTTNTNPLPCPRGCTGAPGAHYGSDEPACPACRDTGAALCDCGAMPIDELDGAPLCAECADWCMRWDCDRVVMRVIVDSYARMAMQGERKAA
jgi:hypothetical protein